MKLNDGKAEGLKRHEGVYQQELTGVLFKYSQG